MTILNLFGRSPFAPLESHMEEVTICVYFLIDLFDALQNKNYTQLEEIAKKIEEQEHKADLTKNNIRNHLPKSLFLAIDRAQLLEILSLQDSIADKAEDIAVLITIKPIEILEPFGQELRLFLTKSIETFNGARRIIKELQELLESSFGGIEAEKVRLMVDDVAFKEHEVDLIQRNLLKNMFTVEEQMPYSTFYLWQKIFQALGAISNLSENLAYRVRMTLELK
jgi:predicted phosphate transport protein (TIGR00153 family)